MKSAPASRPGKAGAMWRASTAVAPRWGQSSRRRGAASPALAPALSSSSLKRSMRRLVKPMVPMACCRLDTEARRPKSGLLAILRTWPVSTGSAAMASASCRALTSGFCRRRSASPPAAPAERRLSPATSCGGNGGPGRAKSSGAPGASASSSRSNASSAAADRRASNCSAPPYAATEGVSGASAPKPAGARHSGGDSRSRRNTSHKTIPTPSATAATSMISTAISPPAQAPYVARAAFASRRPKRRLSQSCRPSR